VANILVIDDDRAIRLMVERGLNAVGFDVRSASTAEEGLDMVRRSPPDVALVDVYLPEMNGLELYRKLRALDRKLPIIFITADNSSETTIEAMRLGAFDYLAKPLNLEQLRELTSSAAESRRLMDQPVAMTFGNASNHGEQFIGRSASMVEVFKAIGRVAEQNVSVLVRGESGSGKELVARAIVQHSPRVDKPFVAVNCAAIPDQLLESELFGVEKGAFTGADQRRQGKFEYCNGGTIFLDEIGDMSLVVQGKVLRIIQEQSFQRLGGNADISTDVRIIAATHRNLEDFVKRGEFREDLFYRLNGYTIQLPPLRQRREDITPLLEYFLNRARVEMNKMSVEGLTPAALDALLAYPWPGNIRQLQSVVRQAMLCTTGTVVDTESLPPYVLENFVLEKCVIEKSPGEAGHGERESVEPKRDSIAAGHWVPFAMASETNGQLEQVDHAGVTDDIDSLEHLQQFIEMRMSEGSENLYAESIEELERFLFRRVLSHTGGNQSKAALMLGITRGKVRDRVAKFALPA